MGVPSSWLAAAAVGGAVITLAIINNHRADNDLSGYSVVRNETVVYRQTATRKVPVEDDGEPADLDAEESTAAGYPRAVQTVKFVNPDGVTATGFAGLRARVMEKVGAFIAFPGKKPAEQSANADIQWPADRWQKSDSEMERVDRYLWEVYQRAPTKLDHSRGLYLERSGCGQAHGHILAGICDRGMDPDFREQLYHAGQAMDAAGIQWSMLSAFRDDYRQSLATGYKARVGRSLHGGSRATGGYGHGRAIDMTNADGEAESSGNGSTRTAQNSGSIVPSQGPIPRMCSRGGIGTSLRRVARESGSHG